MLAEARELFEALKAHFADLEAARLAGDDARELLVFGAEVASFGAGLQAVCAQRATECAGWKDEGVRSKAAWLAGVTRSSVAEANSTLELSEQLSSLEATTGAALRGDLSPAQLRAVAAAAAADPSSEQDLLETAAAVDVGNLRRIAGHVRNAAIRPDLPETRADLHAGRYLRFWSEGDGMMRLSGSFTGDDGARVLWAVRSRSAFVFDDASRAKLPQEAQAAYDADALVALCVGDHRTDTFSGQTATPKHEPSVALIVNAESLRRGFLLPDEVCEIPGVGPVSLEAAESLLGEGTVKRMVKDGVDVLSVLHDGRAVPSHLVSALEIRDPRCVVPECNNSLALEVDHYVIPFSQGGPTELWNLARLCRFHHRLKTYSGFVLEGGPGHWRWRAPGQDELPQPAAIDTS
ncbi:MAG: HNH endonuclease signature motif containing protein [Acidimicrobiales bacterium]